jgi:sulfur carrier protein
VKVKLRNPDRVVEVSGPTTVVDLLQELSIVPEAVLVIRNATLLTRDEKLTETDELEVRPVLSGGSIDRQRGGFGGSSEACERPPRERT